jgi:tetratricopeptide (TPR) repeat protein
MSESTSTTKPDAPHNPDPSRPRPKDDTRNLMRIIWALVAVVVAAIIGFGTFYYLNQRVDSGPTQAERVVSTAEQKVRDNPNDVGARLALAAAYIKTQRPDDAGTQFQEILKVQPNNRSALLGLGGLMYEKGDYEGAKKQYTAVVDTARTGEFAGADKLLQEAYYFRGMSESALKDYAAATKDLQKALIIDRADADGWYALGDAQLQAGDTKNAAQSFQQALLFVPTGWCDPYGGLQATYGKSKNANGLAYAKAMAAICAGDTSDAQLKTLESVASGEFKVPALLGLGQATETSGDLGAAKKWYQQVVKADPSNIAANSAIARLSTDTGSSSGSTPTSTASAS